MERSKRPYLDPSPGLWTTDHCAALYLAVLTSVLLFSWIQLLLNLIREVRVTSGKGYQNSWVPDSNAIKSAPKKIPSQSLNKLFFFFYHYVAIIFQLPSFFPAEISPLVSPKRCISHATTITVVTTTVHINAPSHSHPGAPEGSLPCFPCWVPVQPQLPETKPLQLAKRPGSLSG